MPVNQFLGLVLWGWRDELGQVWNFIKQPLELGTFRISILQFVSGLLIFAIAIFLSRAISTSFERRMAKRAYIDVGLRYTIARMISYLIVTIGIVSGLKAFGVDLTSVALLFTALSVGIGFGLQYIAADIASGFILLFERPIRVGDRITIGDNEEGDVQNIKLRTTIVLTNDRIAIIVPNSKLVSQRVINWSYGDPRVRIAIPVRVSSDSDIDLVTETLLLATEGVENVLEDPPGKVQFMKFGENSLDFRLLVWTRQPSRHPQIRSDIHYRIAKLFRERGIELSFPVQQLRLEATEPTLRDALVRDETGRTPQE